MRDYVGSLEEDDDLRAMAKGREPGEDWLLTEDEWMFSSEDEDSTEDEEV
jgi:hypothetical protein